MLQLRIVLKQWRPNNIWVHLCVVGCSDISALIGIRCHDVDDSAQQTEMVLEEKVSRCPDCDFRIHKY